MAWDGVLNPKVWFPSQNLSASITDGDLVSLLLDDVWASLPGIFETPPSYTEDFESFTWKCALTGLKKSELQESLERAESVAKKCRPFLLQNPRELPFQMQSRLASDIVTNNIKAPFLRRYVSALLRRAQYPSVVALTPIWEEGSVGTGDALFQEIPIRIPPSCMALPTSCSLVILGTGAGITVVDTRSMIQHEYGRGGRAQVSCIAAQHTGEHVVTGFNDGGVVMWALTGKDLVWPLYKHDEAVVDVCLSGDASRVASVCKLGFVRVYNRDGKILHQSQLSTKNNAEEARVMLNDSGTSLTVFDGKHVTGTSISGSWYVTKKKVTRLLGVCSSRSAFICEVHGGVMLFNDDTHKVTVALDSLPRPTEILESMTCCRPLGTGIHQTAYVVWKEEGFVRVYFVRGGGTGMHIVNEHADNVRYVGARIRTDRTRVISGFGEVRRDVPEMVTVGVDNTVRVWHLHGERMGRKFFQTTPLNERRVEVVALCPQGRYLLYLQGEYTFLWDTRMELLTRSTVDGLEDVKSACFLEDGREVLFSDGTRLYRYELGSHPGVESVAMDKENRVQELVFAPGMTKKRETFCKMWMKVGVDDRNMKRRREMEGVRVECDERYVYVYERREGNGGSKKTMVAQLPTTVSSSDMWWFGNSIGLLAVGLDSGGVCLLQIELSPSV